MARHNRGRSASGHGVDPPLVSSAPRARRASATDTRDPAAGVPEDVDKNLPELPLLDEILGRFSDALALVETAHSALDKAQEDASPIAPAVLTLYFGIEELKSVYTELDLTFLHLGRTKEIGD